jgi:hypothetical protein
MATTVQVLGQIDRQTKKQTDRRKDIGGRSDLNGMTGISSRDNLVVAKGDLVVFSLAAVTLYHHTDTVDF